jgi:hypothetical protein
MIWVCIGPLAMLWIICHETGIGVLYLENSILDNPMGIRHALMVEIPDILYGIRTKQEIQITLALYLGVGWVSWMNMVQQNLRYAVHDGRTS